MKVTEREIKIDNTSVSWGFVKIDRKVMERKYLRDFKKRKY